jgi:hypothetical protein
MYPLICAWFVIYFLILISIFRLTRKKMKRMRKKMEAYNFSYSFLVTDN